MPHTIEHNVRDDSIRGLSTMHVDESAGIKRDQVSRAGLASRLAIGDAVFIRVKVLPFLKVAQTTSSWTNHVGIVVDTHGPDPRIAESTFPLSKTTSLSDFVARSAQGRVAVRRLFKPPSADQQAAIRKAVQRRLGIIYDTGFNLHSRRQFCSRFVREVLMEATGNAVGDIERFSDLLDQNPHVDLFFWRLWYFGKIPWLRQTITPASLLNSDALLTVFNGYMEQKRLFSSFRLQH